MSALSEDYKLELIIWYFVRIQYEVLPKAKEVPVDIKQLIKMFAKLTIDSHILSNEQTQKFLDKLSTSKITNMLNIYAKKFKLLYRGSENGYSAKKFHELCDGHGPTFVIIHNQFGNIFGGYTNVKWSSDDRHNAQSHIRRDAYAKWKYDKDAFLFLIHSNDTKVECPQIMKVLRANRAVCHEKEHGPIFGVGYAIKIADKCNDELPESWPLNDRDYSWSYHAGGGNTDYEYKAKELTGSNIFLYNRYFYQVLDYEVFEIV